jgi:hypothetical protein
MGIIADLKKNIGEGERWNGRTQSEASWSPEQLRRELRRPAQSVGIAGQTEGDASDLAAIPGSR